MAKNKGFRTGNGPQKTALITFEEGHNLHGIEVEVNLRVPVGVMLGAASQNVVQAIEPFRARIVSWNLEDDAGEPIPVSKSAFDEQFDTTEAIALVGAWIEAVMAVPTPLDGQSPGGNT